MTGIGSSPRELATVPGGVVVTSPMQDPIRRPEPAPPADPPVPAAAVVVGLDGSASSWDAFWWGCGEARRRGSALLVVYVSPRTDRAAALAASAAAYGVPVDACVATLAEECAEQLRREVATTVAGQDVEVLFLHCRGDAADELLRVGRAAGADAIVVGRSTKVRHHLAGSIGRNLVTRTGAPIVVVVP